MTYWNAVSELNAVLESELLDNSSEWRTVEQESVSDMSDYRQKSYLSLSDKWPKDRFLFERSRKKDS